ncbi:MAG: hypothetical protein SPI86_01710 [Treponemataceae bacterium]|nr:hypothetical protein [Treponemataceae bacterium]
MMQDPFTAKIVSRDARDFARKRKIQKENCLIQEDDNMAITEKIIRKIQKDFEKHNERVLKIFRRNGDKSLLDLLYVTSHNPEELAEKFGISVEEAERLIEKDKEVKADPVGAIEKASNEAAQAISRLFGKSEEHELYTKAFEYVASSGCEEPSVLAAEFGLTEEQAENLLRQMRENGDIGYEDGVSESDDGDYTDDGDCSDDGDYTDDGDCTDEGDESCDSESEKDFSLGDLFHRPEKIIEGLCSLGDVIQETSEKICDALDESIERVSELDFGD